VFRPNNIIRNKNFQVVFELPKGSFCVILHRLDFMCQNYHKNIWYSTLCQLTLLLCDEGTSNYYYMYSAISSLFIY